MYVILLLSSLLKNILKIKDMKKFISNNKEFVSSILNKTDKKIKKMKL